MDENTTPATPSSQHPAPEQWTDFLTPEQRLNAVADILSSVAIRVIKKHYENPESDLNT